VSATNRGAVRRPSDLYETPVSTIQNIVAEIQWPLVHTALEPCAASGRIPRECPGRSIVWTTCEISEGTDYLKAPGPAKSYDLCLTNPPYSLAMEFILKALREAVTVIMLLRLNFLGSQTRLAFWQENPVTHLFPLARRPSFTGHGTDATDYAWFAWDRNCILQRPRGIHVLSGKTLKEPIL